MSPSFTITPTRTVSATYTLTPTPDQPLVLSDNVFYPLVAPLGVEGLAQTRGELQVSIYNILGERIANILTVKVASGQSFASVWDGRNHRGELVGNGIYLVVLRSPAGLFIQKVVVLK